MFNAKDLIEVSDKLGLMQVVKSKLIAQPDPAASKLLAVLSEISKIYLAFEVELVRYLALTIDPNHFKEEKAVLLELEGAKIIARMGEARGHSSRIHNIYTRYLSPWFKRVLNDSEVSIMDRLFDDMSLSDNGMLNEIDRVSNWLANQATKTLDLMEQGQDKQAQQQIAEARKEILPARKAISSAMRQIRDIETDFIEASGAL